MIMFRKAAILAGMGICALALAPSRTSAQAPTSAIAAPSTAPEPQQAGPRLAPRWEPTPVLLPGQSEGREVNSAVRKETVTIPVVTLLLGIIILILLVG